jgi:hypothetical protein
MAILGRYGNCETGGSSDDPNAACTAASLLLFTAARAKLS